MLPSIEKAKHEKNKTKMKYPTKRIKKIKNQPANDHKTLRHDKRCSQNNFYQARREIN